MNIQALSNKELQAYFQQDTIATTEQIQEAALEGVERNLFDPLILFFINQYFGSNNLLYEMSMDKEDMLQYGRLAIYHGIATYEKERYPFKTWAGYKIRGKFGTLIKTHRAGIRKTHHNITSYDKPISEDSDTDFSHFYLVDRYTNVERAAIENILLEDGLKALSKREREVMKYLSVGYTVFELIEDPRFYYLNSTYKRKKFFIKIWRKMYGAKTKVN